jgi:hypothetical protein
LPQRRTSPINKIAQTATTTAESEVRINTVLTIRCRISLYEATELVVEVTGCEMSFMQRITGKVSPDTEPYSDEESVLKDNVVMVENGPVLHTSSRRSSALRPMVPIRTTDDVPSRNQSRRQMRRLSFADEGEESDGVLANVSRRRDHIYIYSLIN